MVIERGKTEVLGTALSVVEGVVVTTPMPFPPPQFPP